jgi:hypothetical protein
MQGRVRRLITGSGRARSGRRPGSGCLSYSVVARNCSPIIFERWESQAALDLSQPAALTRNSAVRVLAGARCRRSEAIAPLPADGDLRRRYGLRPAEWLALEWRDVDPQANRADRSL